MRLGAADSGAWPASVRTPIGLFGALDERLLIAAVTAGRKMGAHGDRGGGHHVGMPEFIDPTARLRASFWLLAVSFQP